MLTQQREWAGFPFLAANVVKKETGVPLVDPYIMKEFDGLHIAIFGLTTEELYIMGDPQDIGDLDFRSVIETAKALVPELREKADLVIALTHIGFHGIAGGGVAGGGYRIPGDLHLAKEVPGIDVIVGAHSHTEVTEPEVIGDTLILQAGEYGLYVGRLDLTIDSEADKITEYTYKLIPVNLKKRIKYHDKS